MEYCLKMTRQMLSDIPIKQDYISLMDSAKLTPTERQVCDYRYLCDYNMAHIGDLMGYSESGIKRIHRRALQKIEKLL